MSVIGIDTSNYTTSIAFFDGVGGENCSKLLPVKQGELGLRQSDAGAFRQAVFQSGAEKYHRCRCQYPSQSGGGQLYALLYGGLFPRKDSF